MYICTVKIQYDTLFAVLPNLSHILLAAKVLPLTLVYIITISRNNIISMHLDNLDFNHYETSFSLIRDESTENILVESALNSWNRVKVSENLGAKSVVPFAPVDKSLGIMSFTSNKSHAIFVCL